MAAWQQEHQRWQGRDLSTRRYVYVWADGVDVTPRLDHDRQCILVLIGADVDGRKALLAIEDGYRDSTRPPQAAGRLGTPESWRELLLRLRDENGLATAPELATGDGALGFWKTLHEVWPTTRQQRSPSRSADRDRFAAGSLRCCSRWVHKTANVLDALPKSVHGKAKKDLHAICQAPSTKQRTVPTPRPPSTASPASAARSTTGR